MDFKKSPRYYSLNQYLLDTYGEKYYKIALSGGMSCPNRDGSLGNKGCIFCSAKGSGDFAGNPSQSITTQLLKGREQLSSKYQGDSFIAYFQAFTETYAPPQRLKELYQEALDCPFVKILSIATRPDCLGEEVLQLLQQANQIKPVWVELGLQTIHPKTASFIRRGYPLSVCEEAVAKLKKIGINVIVHVILYLPGETNEMMLQTIDWLNNQPIDGIKLQLLHILTDTDLYQEYLAHPFFIPTLEDYIHTLGCCISHLRPDIVIHRLTGDGPRNLLFAPTFTLHKRNVLNKLQHYLKTADLWQGKYYSPHR